MLCPRACGVDRMAGQRGACGAGPELLVARAALHFWEEPPISGESGSGTVFLAQCPLGCSYCQNAAISGAPAGEPMDAAGLAERFRQLERQGALNINLVTPTHFAPTLRQAVWLARAQGLGLPVLWNTSGYEAPEAIRANRGIVDAYLTDFKYADSQLAAELSGARDYPERALDALRAMVEEAGSVRFDWHEGLSRLCGGVVVRHLALPGHVDDSKAVVELVWRAFGDAVRLSLMSQYTPVLRTRAEAGDARARRALARHPELGRPLSAAEYEELLDFADGLRIEDYFYQEGDACSESFIPDFGL